MCCHANLVASWSKAAFRIFLKLAAYPRQNCLALTLREVGRLERSIFVLDWLSDVDLQRQPRIGLSGRAPSCPEACGQLQQAW
ncbi:Tn3 family transposase [Brucella intermedia]|uniref:Tn3 family transposase n=1 Tax=Brucella intermedia TaxID=94625 RepID=UPI0009B91E6A